MTTIWIQIMPKLWQFSIFLKVTYDFIQFVKNLNFKFSIKQILQNLSAGPNQLLVRFLDHQITVLPNNYLTIKERNQETLLLDVKKL